MTEFERIKAMDVDQMAKFLADNTHDCDTCICKDDCSKSYRISCKKQFKNWLESKAKE